MITFILDGYLHPLNVVNVMIVMNVMNVMNLMNIMIVMNVTVEKDKILRRLFTC
jgi:hypothetical protein